jgi:hypothetical protein
LRGDMSAQDRIWKCKMPDSSGLIWRYKQALGRDRTYCKMDPIFGAFGFRARSPAALLRYMLKNRVMPIVQERVVAGGAADTAFYEFTAIILKKTQRASVISGVISESMEAP